MAETGAKALPLVCNVKDAAQIAHCVGQIVDQLGGVDILVNNAQETVMGSVLDVTDEAFAAAWESGPLATLRFMRTCYPYLRGGGVVVNMGSSTSVNPTPEGRGVYAAVKGAIGTLGRAAATEWGVDGIRVLTVMPAAMSPSAERFAEQSPEEFARALGAIPLRRMGDPRSDIGRVVAWLCSEAAGYLTGTTIAVDGGQAYLR
jgi:NAD(P)-dependent dehydrogenase (short-subunit alcohol dehydrogenase family)